MPEYRVHYIQHVPYEGVGYIEKWVKDNDYHLSVTKMYDNYTFPDQADFDMLVIMGGPMGTYQEDKHPWLIDEKRFVRESIDKNKVVIGICLGSQLIANALDAEVYPNKEKEIGWLPISFTDKDSQSLFGSEKQSPVVFQWHGDTFDLPTGAKLLASSEACVNQAFLYQEKVVGLQFHFEATQASCADILNNSSEKLGRGESVQSESYIRANTQHIPSCNKMLETLLNKLTEL